MTSKLASNDVIGKYASGAIPPPPTEGGTTSPPPADLDDQWSEVTRQQDTANEGTKFGTRGGGITTKQDKDVSITFKDAWDGIQLEGSWRTHLPSISRVAASVSDGGFFTKMWLCCFVPNVASGELSEERDFVLCLQNVPLNTSDPIHQRVLTTIYRRITHERGSCALSGSHFEKIGFQGGNPGTDLRSTGMFGLLQMLYFTEKSPKLISQSYAVAMNPMLDFSWALASLNFSGMVMEALKEQSLNGLINQRKSTIEVMCEVHMGLFCLFTEEWKSQEKRSIVEFDPIKKKLAAKAKSDPKGCVAAFQKILASGFVKLGDGKPLTFTEF